MSDKNCYCCGHGETTEEEYRGGSWSGERDIKTRRVCDLCREAITGCFEPDRLTRAMIAHQSRCAHAIIKAMREAAVPIKLPDGYWLANKPWPTPEDLDREGAAKVANDGICTRVCSINSLVCVRDSGHSGFCKTPDGGSFNGSPVREGEEQTEGDG